MVTRFTRLGLILSSVLAIMLALFFRSVVDIWHVFGSIGTPALLIPVFMSFVGKRRLAPYHAFVMIVSCGCLSLIWYLSRYMGSDATFWLGVQPIFPGLLLSIILYFSWSRKASVPLQ